MTVDKSQHLSTQLFHARVQVGVPQALSQQASDGGLAAASKWESPDVSRWVRVYRRRRRVGGGTHLPIMPTMNSDVPSRSRATCAARACTRTHWESACACVVHQPTLSAAGSARTLCCASLRGWSGAPGEDATATREARRGPGGQKCSASPDRVSQGCGTAGQGRVAVCVRHAEVHTRRAMRGKSAGAGTRLWLCG